MSILSLDTSTDGCVVVLDIDGVHYCRQERQPRQQLQLILPMVDSLMREAGIVFSELSAIAYGCGPGSFTGVRIAMSVAQGLSFGFKIPLIPISSLAILAQSALIKSQSKEILMALDAKQGKACLGHYSLNERGVMLSLQEDRLVSVASLSGYLNLNTRCALFGALWGSVLSSAPTTQRSFIEQPLIEPEALLKLALYYYQTGRKDAALEVMPGYLR